MPKISVIMPVYNGARFIREAIDSLFVQTFSNWELIVIDDGSTDKTPEILSSYQDPRIQVFHQLNGGEARARNAGLDRVSGEYVAFLDSDDQYLPNALQDYAAFLDSHPQFDVVFSDGYICDSNNNRLSRLTEIRPGIYNGNILEYLVISPAVITVPVCTAFRYAAAKQFGARFDPDVGYGTDWDFWTQLAVNVQFGYLDRPTCLYRIHGTNMTSSATIAKRKSDQLKGRFKVFNSAWYGNLPLRTQEKFIYNLVITLMSDCPEKQLEYLESSQAKNIHPVTRARFYRLAGVEVLQNLRDQDLANTFFTKSSEINPLDIKARLLLWFTTIPRPVALFAIKIWRAFYEVLARLYWLGKRRPKALPDAYGPVATK